MVIQGIIIILKKHLSNRQIDQVLSSWSWSYILIINMRVARLNIFTRNTYNDYNGCQIHSMIRTTRRDFKTDWQSLEIRSKHFCTIQGLTQDERERCEIG